MPFPNEPQPLLQFAFVVVVVVFAINQHSCRRVVVVVGDVGDVGDDGDDDDIGPFFVAVAAVAWLNRHPHNVHQADVANRYW